MLNLCFDLMNLTMHFFFSKKHGVEGECEIEKKNGLKNLTVNFTGDIGAHIDCFLTVSRQ